MLFTLPVLGDEDLRRALIGGVFRLGFLGGVATVRHPLCAGRALSTAADTHTHSPSEGSISIVLATLQSKVR